MTNGVNMTGLQAVLFLVGAAVILGLLFVLAGRFGESRRDPGGTPFDPPPRA